MQLLWKFIPANAKFILIFYPYLHLLLNTSWRCTRLDLFSAQNLEYKNLTLSFHDSATNPQKKVWHKIAL